MHSIGISTQTGMKIKLIRPKVKNNVHALNFYVSSILGKPRFLAPPLQLAIIASLTPKDIEVSIKDENIGEIGFDEPADLVGITITSFTAPRGYEIADAFRKRGVPVVIGGIHASLMSKESLKHADSIVIGEAENLWDKVICDFKKGKLKKVYKSKTRPALEGIAPAWELVDNNRYAVAAVSITRGCPHNCEFCVAAKHFGRNIRRRPISDVMEEIKFLKKHYTQFWFVDYNLFFDREYAKQLLKELAPLGIKYFCFANAYIYNDDELLGLLSKSGCVHVIIGFETTNVENLKLIHKAGINKASEYALAISRIQSYGIQVKPQFIVGLDYDDAGVFKRIEDFVNDNILLFPEIYLTGVFCGTRYCHRLMKEGQINREDFSGKACSEYGYSICASKALSQRELLIGLDSLYRRLYSLPAILKRLAMFYVRYKLKTKAFASSEKASLWQNLGKAASAFRYYLFACRLLLSIMAWRKVFLRPILEKKPAARRGGAAIKGE